MYKEKDRSELEHLQNAYYNKIDAPIDDYWQHVIASGTYYAIENGYFILDGNTLMQYVQDPFSDQDFKKIIDDLKIKKAQVCTYESDYLSYVEKYFKHSKRIAYFYKDVKDVKIELLDDIQEKLATIEDLPIAVQNSEGPETWLLEYLNALIARKSLYLYFINHQMVGTGEIRTQEGNKYANIGMTVVAEFRRRYIGTYILNRMKIIAKENGYIPICGTDLANIGSQKTISKCGFEKHHYVKEFSL